MKINYEILFEDDDIVLVNKPPFLLTIPDRFAPEKPNLYHQLLQQFGKIFVVHRLDKETSGILVFAKNEETHKELSRQFQERLTEKIYTVLVEGNLHQMEGTIEKAISPHPSHPDRMVISSKGKPSITHYKVLEYFKNFTLLEANIKTGRTHQIRIHFQSIGYPLAVDSLYGRRDAFLLSDVKTKKFRLGKNEEERPLMYRSSLHASKLTFSHPITSNEMTFEADLPKDFAAVVNQLRKWGK